MSRKVSASGGMLFSLRQVSKTLPSALYARSLLDAKVPRVSSAYSAKLRPMSALLNGTTLSIISPDSCYFYDQHNSPESGLQAP